MLLWTQTYKYLIETLLSVFLSMYPELELLDHIVIPFLILWGTILFPIADVPFYIPTKGAQGLQFLSIHINACYFLFFVFDSSLPNECEVPCSSAVHFWND